MTSPEAQIKAVLCRNSGYSGLDVNRRYKKKYFKDLRNNTVPALPRMTLPKAELLPDSQKEELAHVLHG